MALQWLWVYLQMHKTSKASREDTCARMGLQQIKENTWESGGWVNKWRENTKNIISFDFGTSFMLCCKYHLNCPVRFRAFEKLLISYCVVQVVLRSTDTDMWYRYDTKWIRKYDISLKSNTKTQWGYVVLYIFSPIKICYMSNHKFGSQ